MATVRGQGCEFSNLADRLLFLMEVAMLRPSVDIKKTSHKSVQKGTARVLESAQNEVFHMERISTIRYMGIIAGVIISFSSS